MKNDDKILTFTGNPNADISVETMLSKAKEENLEEAIIVGYTKEGDFYFCSANTDGGTMLWLMEIAKKMLLDYEP